MVRSNTQPYPADYRRELHDGSAHHHAVRRAPPAQPQQPAAAHSRNAASFVVGHGKRQVRFGPIVFWTIVGTLVIMAGWSVVTATYFAFRDDVLARLISKQAEMQTAYEDRIAEMRAQVDRVTSRQLLDQEQFEQKLEQLMRRQATLESRATTLGTFAEPATTGSVKPTARGEPPSSAATKAAPADGATAAPDRGASLEQPRGFSAIVARITGRPNGGGITGTLKRVQESLDRIEARQAGVLNALEENVEGKARRMRSVLADLGLPVSKPPESTGGPFVPLRLPGDGFERQLQRIHVARAHLDRLSRSLVTVPVRKPVQGELDLSSGFGVRVDPFLGRPAMHTGLDFRGDTGDPVRATAAGSITHAGYSGGYGKMVEIDHGNGLSTRYGHLSEINVSIGQNVKIGQVVGRIGSTGRSTGPHLHYETRSDGDAVDPQKFLRAGAKLGLGS